MDEQISGLSRRVRRLESFNRIHLVVSTLAVEGLREDASTGADNALKAGMAELVPQKRTRIPELPSRAADPGSDRTARGESL
jgi:hypothetical protein